MEFMKVLDQAVREIKREVNLKVLKVPEIEQKVLDATDDEPWGPHGTVLAEIARATNKYTECQMVMNVLWTRLSETGKNWRFVYKSLAVIEYLVAHGSERAVDDIIEHTYQISSLASFEYVEPSGKDLGINVRKKAETIVALLNDKDKIQNARDKAAANRDKYFGLSSTGITYKSGAASSMSSSNFRSSDRYGGFGNTLDSDTFKDSYKGKDRYGEDKYGKSASKKRSSNYGSKERDSPATSAPKTSTKTGKVENSASVTSQNAPSDKYDGDFDDFDPRGSSTSKPSTVNDQVDLFGQNFIDIVDAPVSVPTDQSSSLGNNPSAVDFFADADFVSATPEPESGKHSEPPASIDLFASQPASAPSATVDLFASQPAPAPAPAPSTTVDIFAPQPSPAPSITVDFFTAPDQVPKLDNEASKSETTSNTVDPFAAVALNNFDQSDPFDAFTSHANPSSTVSNKISPNEGSSQSPNEPTTETKVTPKKEAFQVKSGIWADSLSRGLIDLNITGPKKVNLADVGIIGGLTDGSEEKDKVPQPSFFMGTAMGTGSSSLGNNYGFTSTPSSTNDDFFSSLSTQQNQSGTFPK